MALTDSKILFWNGKIPAKSVQFDVVNDKDYTEQSPPSPIATPSVCGVPLKYISYVFPRRHSHSHISCGLRLCPVLSAIIPSVYPRILIASFQSYYTSSPECCPLLAHALFPRVVTPIPGILRSIRSPCNRASKGPYITAYCID